MIEHTNLNEFAESPLASDVRLTLQSTTKVDISQTTRPLWISTTAFVYVSGCSLFKYDLRGPQCTIIPKLPKQQSIKFLTYYSISNEDCLESINLAYIYSQNGRNILTIRSPEPEDSTIRNITLSPQVEPHSIKCLVFLNNNKYAAVLTECTNTHIQTICIYKVEKATELVKQQWLHPIEFLLEGTFENSLLTVDQRGLSLHVYCSLAIEVDVIKHLPVEDRVYNAQVYNNQLVILVTKPQILFCWPEQTNFKVQTVNLKLDILESDDIGAVAIKDSLIVIALSNQRLLTIQFNIQDLAYSTKVWIDTGMVGVRVEMIAISHLCQNVLMLCRREKDEQKSLQVFGYESCSLSTKKKVRVSKLPMNCQGSESMGIAVSCLKQQVWHLTNKTISIYPNFQIPLQHTTCIQIDPFGLFVVIGFQFYFNVFAVRRQGLLMLHSEPALYTRKIKYLVRYPLLLIMFKHQFRLYHSHSFEQLWEEETANIHIEFLSFQVNQRESQAIFTLSCGALHLYDLISRQRKRQFRIEERVPLFEYNWFSQMLIYPNKNKLVVMHCQPMSINKPTTTITEMFHEIVSLKLCIEMGVLFLGYSNGSIEAYRWPFQSISPTFSSHIRLFEQPVSFLEISMDRNYLYASSKSGNFAQIVINYYQNDQPVCKDTMISILRNCGVGFSTYYLNNIAMQAIQKNNNVQVQIQNLEIEHENKHVKYEQQVQQIQNNMQKQSIQTKNRYQQQYNGVLIQHRNVLRFSKIQFKILQNKLSKTSQINHQQQKDPQNYINIIKCNQQLTNKLNNMQKQFNEQKQSIKKIYQNQLLQIQQKHTKQFIQKQSKFNHVERLAKRSYIIDYTILNQKQFSPTLQLQLNNVQKQLESLLRSNQQLKVKIDNINAQKHKFQTNISQYKMIIPQLDTDLQRVTQENTQKIKQFTKMYKQHKLLQSTLENQSTQEKQYGNDSLKYNTVIDQLLRNAKQLQHYKMKKINQEYQGLTEYYGVMQKYLADEAMLKFKYNDTLDRLKQQKQLLKVSMNKKKHQLYMSQYAIKQFASNVEQTKRQLTTFIRPIKHQKHEQIGYTSRQSKKAIIHKLCLRQRNNQYHNQYTNKTQNTSIKLHIQQNQQLIHDLNALAVERRSNQCQLNIKMNLTRAVRASLKNYMVETNNKNQFNQQKLTPFKRYHLDKTSTPKIKFHTANATAATSIRTSKSSNSSILENSIRISRTPLIID